MKQLLIRLFDSISTLRIKLPRLIDSRVEFNMKKKNLNCEKPSNENAISIKSYWRDIKIDARYVNMYNTFSTSFDPRYIPDDLYYGTVDVYYNNALECAALDDKNLYDLYFFDAPQPETIFRRVSGAFISKDYSPIDKSIAIEKCRLVGGVIFKKSVSSEGGRGIQFWKKEDGIEKLSNMIDNSNFDYVVQGLIEQHNEIAKLHPSSVNSIRMLTLTEGGKTEMLSAIIRIGANGSSVDNGHSGGMFVGIDSNGRLRDVAYDYMTGKRYEKVHPTTGVEFASCTIPNFSLCKQLVINLAPRISRFSKLTSWDLSVNKEGQPILIEVNLCYGGLFFHQMGNGPIFGDKAYDVVKKIYKSYE